MILKSFIVAVISVIIFLFLLAFLTYLISPGEFDGNKFILLLFYGGGALIPLVFAILWVLNLMVQWRIRSLKNNRPNTVYFLYSIVVTVVPVLAFVLFDYAQRDRSFEKQTFLSITGEYIVYFILAIFTILLNRKIVWNNFKRV